MNANEAKCYEAIKAAAEAATGGEFCDAADVQWPKDLTPNQIKGYLSALQAKRLISLDVMRQSNSPTYTQITVS